MIRVTAAMEYSSAIGLHRELAAEQHHRFGRRRSGLASERGQWGAHCRLSANLVGGTDASRPAKCSGVCNLISGNGGDGVFIDGTHRRPVATCFAGNAIGLRNTIDCIGNPLDESQACDNGNAGAGVRISGNAPGNHIGGHYGLSLATFCTGDCNLMAFNGEGVVIEGDLATLNNVQSNYLIHNGGLPIDLGGDGPTINDDVPPTGNDQDGGPNMRQNFPRIEVVGEKGAAAWVLYNLPEHTQQRVHGRRVRQRVLAAALTPTEMHLGYHSITTDANGERTASVDVSLAQLAVVDINFISLTATGASGNTSEPSPCVAFQPLTDQLQADVAAGNTVLLLDNGQGVTVGDILEVGAGPVQENAIVQWFQNNANLQSARPGGISGVMVTLESPLQFSHPAGTSVTNLGPEGKPAMALDWGDFDCQGGYNAIDVVQLLQGVADVGRQGTGCPEIGVVVKASRRLTKRRRSGNGETSTAIARRMYLTRYSCYETWRARRSAMWCSALRWAIPYWLVSWDSGPLHKPAHFALVRESLQRPITKQRYREDLVTPVVEAAIDANGA